MAQATIVETAEDVEITTVEDEEAMAHLADKNDPTAMVEADTRTEDTTSSHMAANSLHQDTR